MNPLPRITDDERKRYRRVSLEIDKLRKGETCDLSEHDIDFWHSYDERVLEINMDPRDVSFNCRYEMAQDRDKLKALLRKKK